MVFEKIRLCTPGPTPVPPAVVQKLGEANLYHRSEAFANVVRGVREKLQNIFDAETRPVVLTGSGTAAMEMSSHLLGPISSKTLCLVAGKFGERWAAMHAQLGYPTEVWKVHPEEAIPVDSILSKVLEGRFDCLLFQANETSTGLRFPTQSICQQLRQQNWDGWIGVDGVSALCAEPVRMRPWGIDVLFSGSQKGFGTPPGLSFVAASPRLQAKMQPAKTYYLDWAKEYRAQEKGQTAFTPATSLFVGLQEALHSIEEVGLEKIWAHHQKMMEAVHAFVAALGLELLIPKNCDHHSKSVTAIRAPGQLSVSDLLKTCRDQDGVILSNGQDAWKDKIFRIAHLGFVDRLDLISCLASVEFALHQKAASIEKLGTGTSAAMQVLKNQP